MMDEKDCLNTLLDDSSRIEEKAEALAEFIRAHEALARNMHISVVHGRSRAFQALYEALSKDDEQARSKLDGVFESVAEYYRRREEERRGRAKDLARALRQLQAGTAIVVEHHGRKETVALVQMNRTRFIFEYPDGRRFSAPVEAFVEAAEGEKVELLTDAERENRELARALAGRYSAQARAEILDRGAAMLDALLDELAATMKRINDAPVGLSRGVLGSTVGPVKSISPHDQALVKQITAVVCELTRRTPADRVVRKARNYPNHEVSQQILDALSG